MKINFNYNLVDPVMIILIIHKKIRLKDFKSKYDIKYINVK